MQQFQVPQFIDVEDKLFGPLTVKQLVYLIGGGGLIIVLWAIRLPTFIFWIFAIVIAGFFSGLAFAKINGRPAIDALNNALNHFTRPRIYIWKRAPKDPKKKPDQTLPPQTHVPQLSEEKLKELSWSLDINEKLQR